MYFLCHSGYSFYLESRYTNGEFILGGGGTWWYLCLHLCNRAAVLETLRRIEHSLRQLRLCTSSFVEGWL
jgi:hypothetical protein